MIETDLDELFSPAEQELIGQVKRFLEWAQGDPDCWHSATSAELSAAQLERLRSIGVTFDVAEVASAWPGLVSSAMACHPVVDLWSRFLTARQEALTKLAEEPIDVPSQPRFDAWRRRRLAAMRSELGALEPLADRRILALELADGCSVGCWFCAFAPEKLRGTLDHRERQMGFRELVRSWVSLFGREQARFAMPYWATEPHDNPHHLDFLRDYEEISGAKLRTTTAVATDGEWIRQLLDYYPRSFYPWLVISVLSRRKLRSIHDRFSPRELLTVHLRLQMREQPRLQLVAGGRILAERREAGDPPGSIACVSGFLVNTVRRTVQLISPCCASRRWPLGYRIFDRATFSDADDFRRVVERMIDRNMPAGLPGSQPLRFRDDLAYRAAEEGFDLVSPVREHRFRHAEVHPPVGRLIAEGRLRYREAVETLTGDFRIRPLAAMAALASLFEGGFLDELPAESTAPTSALRGQGGASSEESRQLRL